MVRAQFELMLSRRSVEWDVRDKIVTLLDQRLLPATIDFVQCRTVEDVAEHIVKMTVRGAPAIGAAGGVPSLRSNLNSSVAFGMVIAAFRHLESSDVVEELKKAKHVLDSTRPTAVNLSWATARILEVALQVKGHPGREIAEILESEALALAEEDVDINRRLGDLGSSLIPPRANFIHHCNTGHLATVQYGTALGVWNLDGFRVSDSV